VEKSWRPNIEKLKEVGLSIDDISCIISNGPATFQSYFVPKVDFLLRAVGSAENLSLVLKRCPTVLCNSLENVLVPNLSVLEKECPHCQVVKLIKLLPRILSFRPEALKMKLKRAEKLGIARSSPMFIYALIIVCCLKEHIINARLDNLKRLGFSQDEVTSLVNRSPNALKITEELMGRKLEFLIKEMGFDKLFVITNPVFLTLSLDKRLIPRNLVKKLLELKGLSGAKGSFTTYVIPNEKQFIKRIVLPYEQAIPGLHRAYINACSGKSSAREWFQNISN
jgi:mTERF domain-containing protein, mitochondrial